MPEITLKLISNLQRSGLYATVFFHTDTHTLSRITILWYSHISPTAGIYMYVYCCCKKGKIFNYHCELNPSNEFGDSSSNTSKKHCNHTFSGVEKTIGPALDSQIVHSKIVVYRRTGGSSSSHSKNCVVYLRPQNTRHPTTQLDFEKALTTWRRSSNRITLYIQFYLVFCIVYDHNGISTIVFFQKKYLLPPVITTSTPYICS